MTAGAGIEEYMMDLMYRILMEEISGLLIIASY